MNVADCEIVVNDVGTRKNAPISINELINGLHYISAVSQSAVSPITWSALATPGRLSNSMLEQTLRAESVTGFKRVILHVTIMNCTINVTLRGRKSSQSILRMPVTDRLSPTESTQKSKGF